MFYQDIIDDKIASWRNSLKRLEEKAADASEDKPWLKARLDQLKPRLESAVAQLRALDEQENPKNTLETKDKILGIFNSIDKDFPRYDEETPYML